MNTIHLTIDCYKLNRYIFYNHLISVNNAL